MLPYSYPYFNFILQNYSTEYCVRYSYLYQCNIANKNEEVKKLKLEMLFPAKSPKLYTYKHTFPRRSAFMNYDMLHLLYHYKLHNRNEIS